MPTYPRISRLLSSLLLAAAFFGVGCASPAPGLVLQPVGPPSSDHPVTAPVAGTLVVYSAYETGATSPALPDDVRLHTRYEIRSAQGVLLQTVSNRAGPYGEEPSPVELPPGRYLVAAQANGHGVVTVPVIVAAGQTTAVHLERGLPVAAADTH